jgi:hypothetical protein
MQEPRQLTYEEKERLVKDFCAAYLRGKKPKAILEQVLELLFGRGDKFSTEREINDGIADFLGEKREFHKLTTRVQKQIGDLKKEMEKQDLTGICLRIEEELSKPRDADSGKSFRLVFEFPLGLARIWHAIVLAGTGLVLFSNNEFIRLPNLSLVEVHGRERELYYVQRSTDDEFVQVPLKSADFKPEHVVSLTGAGEVVAALLIDRLLRSSGTKVTVKRALLANAEELKDQHVIYIGSSFTNRRLREILPVVWAGTSLNYEFKVMGKPPKLGILDVHSRKEYRRESLNKEGSSWVDHAALCFLTDAGAKTAVVLAGTSTWGTQGLAEYLCSPQGNTELNELLSNSVGSFEVLAQVQVANDQPLGCRLLRETFRSSVKE